MQKDRRAKKTTANKKMDLPYDVFPEILARLPARSLDKFRCVSKSWKYLIEKDTIFVSHYLRTPSPLKNKPGIVTLANTSFKLADYVLSYKCGDDKLHSEFDFTPIAQSGDDKLHNEFDFTPIAQKFYMTNSCNGLVCVYGLDVFFLVNPSLSKVMELPGCSPHAQYIPEGMPRAAIGFDSAAEEYKVVRVFSRDYSPSGHLIKAGCEVFSLSIGGWRLVEDPPLLRCLSFSVPVVVNGVIYWTVEITPFRKAKSGRKLTLLQKPEIAVSFNLREEKFSVVLHPNRQARPVRSLIFLLGGQVCLADTMVEYKMTVWTLKDHNNSVWEHLYNIDLSKMNEPIDGTLILPMTIEGDGRIILYYLVGGKRKYYDPVTMSFVKHEKIDQKYFQFATSYPESIIWPWS